MQIKKFLATGLSAIMAGATLAGGAVAQTLGDYPTFLGNNGQLDVFVVVGADAQPADIVGAGDVVAGLASLSYTMVSTGASGVTTVGGDTENLDLGTELNATAAFGSKSEDQDVTGLFDDEVTISIGGTSDSYDVHDEIRYGDGSTGTIKLMVGSNASTKDEDWKDAIFLEALAGSVEYRYVFDEDLKNGNMIANATDDDPVILTNFMGRELRITAATATSITVESGERFSLKAGESAVTSDGKTVTLNKAVSTTKAEVTVNGATEIISENSVRNLGGVEVKVTDVADDEGIEFDSATVIVGTAATNGEASDTFNDGDEYIVPCGTAWKSDGCDKDDPDWVWNLAGLNQGTASSIVLGVIFNENIDTPDDNPPTLGTDNNKLDLPGGFAWISLDRATTDSYQKYTFSKTNADLVEPSGASIATAAKVLQIEGEGNDDAFQFSLGSTAMDLTGTTNGTKNTDKIYLQFNHSATANDTVSMYWADPDDGNKIKLAKVFTPSLTGQPSGVISGDLATMKFQGSSVQLSFQGNIGNNTYQSTDGSNITLAIEPSTTTRENVTFFVEEDEANGGQINWLGEVQSDTTANDIKVGKWDISSYDYNVRTVDGLIIETPEPNDDSDKFKVSIPAEYGTNEFQVFVTVGSSGTTSTTSSGGIKQLVPITGSVTKLDTEVSSSSVDRHLVLVGGPAVNRLTAEAMGLSYPSYGSASGIPENAAVIRIVDDAFTAGKTAVIVAGWEADDTRLATSVLQQAATKLAGVTATSATVTGTSVASAVITPA